MGLTTNEANDHTTSFEAYPTYSLGILWSMRALTPEEFEHAAVSPTPLDGDALARSANRAMLTAAEWSQIRGDGLRGLRSNHGEIDRPNR